MMVAFSDSFAGAGIFAGGPYYCCRGKLLPGCGTYGCAGPDISSGENPGSKNKVFELIASVAFNFSGKEHPIADPKNIKDKPIFLYSGMNDNTIGPSVVANTNYFWKTLGASTTFVNRFVSDHLFPVDRNGVEECAHGGAGSTSIGNCNFDGAGHMFKKIMPGQD